MEEDHTSASSADSDTPASPEPAPARAQKASAKFRTDTDVALIACVRARPVLYDPGHSRYMDVQLKNTIWNKIGKQVKVNPTACKTRWNNIRDNYRKSLRRRHLPGNHPYKFGSHLTFMDRYYKGQPLAAEDSDSNQEAEKPKGAPVAVEAAQSDAEDQASALDEFERSSVSVSGYQVSGNAAAATSTSLSHSVDVFLAAIAPALKGLGPYDLSMAKAEIFATVHKYELKGIVEGGWETREVKLLP